MGDENRFYRLVDKIIYKKLRPVSFSATSDRKISYDIFKFPDFQFYTLMASSVFLIFPSLMFFELMVNIFRRAIVSRISSQDLTSWIITLASPFCVIIIVAVFIKYF